MIKNIKLENLGTELVDMLEEFKFKSKVEINNVTKETATDLKNIIKEKAPNRRGNYKNSISVRKKGNSINDVSSYIVYAKDPYYRLVHLLEKGHALKGGGRVRAYPHFGPGLTEIAPIYVSRLKKAMSDN